MIFTLHNKSALYVNGLLPHTLPYAGGGQNINLLPGSWHTNQVPVILRRSPFKDFLHPEELFMNMKKGKFVEYDNSAVQRFKCQVGW